MTVYYLTINMEKLVEMNVILVPNQLTHIQDEQQQQQTLFCVNTHIYWSNAVNRQNIMLKILLLNSFLKIQVYIDCD